MYSARYDIQIIDIPNERRITPPMVLLLNILLCQKLRLLINKFYTDVEMCRQLLFTMISVFFRFKIFLTMFCTSTYFVHHLKNGITDSTYT